MKLNRAKFLTGLILLCATQFAMASSNLDLFADASVLFSRGLQLKRELKIPAGHDWATLQGGILTFHPSKLEVNHNRAYCQLEVERDSKTRIKRASKTAYYFESKDPENVHLHRTKMVMKFNRSNTFKQFICYFNYNKPRVHDLLEVFGSWFGIDDPSMNYISDSDEEPRRTFQEEFERSLEAF